MNKDNLQKELLEKIKAGIKPSDLKKKKDNNSIPSIPKNTGSNTTPASTPPPSPIITPIDKKPSKKQGQSDIFSSPISINKKIQELQREVKFWSTTASNHLTNLQKATADNDSLKLELKELHQNPAQLNKEVEKALKEANQKIRDQEKTISDLDYLLKSGKNSEIIKGLQEKIKEQDKTIEELKKQTKNTDKTKQTNIKEVKDQSTQTPLKTFFCDSCQLTKQGEYIKRKVDAPFEPRLHGRTCYLCSSCSPYTKELNDLDIKDNHNQLHD